MILLIMQHCDAISKEQNSDRPLSEKGNSDCSKIGNLLKNKEIIVQRILHSGKTRALQTAQIISGTGFAGEIESVSGLNPLDPVSAMVEKIFKESKDSLIISHMPFVGKLVSLLFAGKEDFFDVGFVPGSIVCMEINQKKVPVLLWMVSPELLY